MTFSLPFCHLAVSEFWRQSLPSRMTVMGLGLNPSPPGQRVLYSATDVMWEKSLILLINLKKYSLVDAPFAVNIKIYDLWRSCGAYLSWGQGRVHRGFPRLLPGSSSKKLGSHRLRSLHCRRFLHHHEQAHPRSSCQHGCLRERERYMEVFDSYMSKFICYFACCICIFQK